MLLLTDFCSIVIWKEGRREGGLLFRKWHDAVPLRGGEGWQGVGLRYLEGYVGWQLAERIFADILWGGGVVDYVLYGRLEESIVANVVD